MRRLPHLTAIVVAVLALAPAAHAGTLSRSGATFVYTATPGEQNDFSIYPNDDGTWYVQDVVEVTYDPSSGCAQYSCPGTGITAISIDLGDGDDRAGVGATSVPVTLDGGDGNDDLVDGNGDDTVRGGPGDDKLHSNEGHDYLDGGPGADQILASFKDDTIDCTAGGGDRVDQQGADPGANRLVGCGAGPALSVKVQKTRIGKLVSKGMPFTISCGAPCAVQWLLVPGDRQTAGRVHTGCGCLDRHAVRFSDSFFKLAPAGTQPFTGRVLGRATQKAVRKAKSIKVKLVIRAWDALSVERDQTVTLKLKR